jgi:hypothetical protein
MNEDRVALDMRDPEVQESLRKYNQMLNTSGKSRA